MQMDGEATAALARDLLGGAARAPGAGDAPAPGLQRVLLHGFAGTPASWTPTLQALAEAGADAGGGSHALTLPGHGAPLPPPPATFHHAVALLLAQLPPPPAPVHLVGYSLGARLALGLALAAPGRLRCLTLIGVQPGLESLAARQARRRHDQSWQRCLRGQGMAAFVKAWQAQPLFASQAHVPSARLQAQAQGRYGLDAAALADAFDCVGLAAMPNYWPQLRRLQLPVAVVVGALDEKFCHLVPRMLRLLPHGHATVVPGVGHNVALEAPAALAQLLVAHERRAGLAPSPGGAPGAPANPSRPPG